MLSRGPRCRAAARCAGTVRTAPAPCARCARALCACAVPRLPPMSRFEDPQHSDFRRLNDSIGVDFRLWPHDIAQSRAHVRMLAERGIVTAKDAEALLAGAGGGEGERGDR